MRTIGLTGGIGSGKSTVAAMLVRCGAHLVDSDAIARALTAAGGAALPALEQAFGARALAADGALDRAWMRERAFADPAAKARLEAVLHPLIGQEAQRQAAAARGRPVVHDVPLLAESRGPAGWRARVDRVLVVDCAEATQIARVAQRPGWTEAVAQQVVAQQATRARRRAVADAVLFNEDLSPAALEAQVRALWALWFGTAEPVEQ
ncbi:MAG: dephospho-CoA kinase [Burkholderiales bacterium]|nr:dephospho-CoA kinase [Burkholderiales bacterium]MDE2276828.1 dephospho-CoA kinase [Burkholderiales bacterium]